MAKSKKKPTAKKKPKNGLTILAKGQRPMSKPRVARKKI